MKIGYVPDTHFGVYNQALPEPEEVADAAEHLLKEGELAEKVGFDGLWLPERHSRPETFFPNTTTLLAALAARTERVDLVTAVMMPTFHHPVHLAEELAMIDNLSRGRLIFGAGVGYHEDYFRLFGVPMAKRGRRFEETMKVIEGVWTNERFSFDGEFYKYDDVLLTPKPFQKPRPDIWIGAVNPVALNRALEWDGWVWWFPPGVEETARLVNEMREKADKAGRKNWVFTMGLDGWFDDDVKRAKERHGHRWVREYSFYEQEGLGMEERAGAQEALEERFLTLGGKQQWVDYLSKVKEVVKPDYIALRTRNPKPEAGGYYPSKQECLECIEQLGGIIDQV
tara:strand:- start:1444 stop:2463 length:1020 start_codon:yes stop_codon:yes gene_type:complete